MGERVSGGASHPGSAARDLYHRGFLVDWISCHLYLFLFGECRKGGAQGPGTEKQFRNVCGAE